MVVRTTFVLVVVLAAIGFGQVVDPLPSALRPVPVDPIGQRVALGPYTAADTDDARVGAHDFDLGTIPRGQIFTVETCGQADGDTYLRVVDDQGTEHAAGTGGCQTGVAGTRLSMAAPSTRRFQVRAGCVGSTACSGHVTGSSTIELHERWAPVVFQDTWPSEYFLRGDYITSVNFDGDYVGKNNWENADSSNAAYRAHVYYSRVETQTHYFVGYYFFHPQDRSGPNQHENDLEGILLAIRKAGLYGELIAMETIAHGPFYQYVTPGLGTTESPTGTAPDGMIVRIADVATNPATGTPATMPYLIADHPAVYVEPGGHGVHSCNRNAGNVNCGDNDGVVYAFRGGVADDPYAGNCDDGSEGPFDLLNACGYALVSIGEWGGSTVVADPAVTQGLWVLQNHICDTCTMVSFTNFRGDEGGGCGDGFPMCTPDAANMPWQWRDHAGVNQGDWVSDPALLFKIDFEGPEFAAETWSHEYVRHPYFSHALEMNRTRLRTEREDGSPLLTVLAASHDGKALIGFYHWLKNEPVVDTWYSWFYGADDADDENTWAQSDLNRYFFTRQTQVRDPATGVSANGGASIRIAVLDSALSIPALVSLAPNDRTSGTCVSGCLDGNCRAHVNDFTCGDGFAGSRADVAFKLTRIRRPSPPPAANAGLDQVVECTAPTGAGTTLDGRGSSHPEGDTITYQWSAPGVVFNDPTSATPAATFPLGDTVVTLAVSDGTWETRDTVTIRVADRTPPALQVTLTPNVLTPPRHQLVPIEAAVTAVDACDPAPRIVLTGISSNEPDNGMGDGDTADDIQGEQPGTIDTSFQLRAERSARGAGRVYTVIYRAIDARGNVSTVASQVTVPLAATGIVFD